MRHELTDQPAATIDLVLDSIVRAGVAHAHQSGLTGCVGQPDSDLNCGDTLQRVGLDDSPLCARVTYGRQKRTRNCVLITSLRASAQMKANPTIRAV